MPWANYLQVARFKFRNCQYLSMQAGTKYIADFVQKKCNAKNPQQV